MTRIRCSSLLFFALASNFYAGAAFGEAGFARGPAPAWVEVVTAPASAPVTRGEDVLHLLFDTQTRVSAKGTERFTHVVKRIVNEGGVESAAQLELSVNPAFEKLALHWVRRLRDGKVANALNGADISVLHREERLGARVFDGSRTVVIVLHDVRVGDVLDYAYTLQGQNPVFEGRFAGSLAVAFGVPISKILHRLIWPAGRELATRNHGTTVLPQKRPHPEGTEWRWSLENVAAVESEDLLPDGFDPYPWVQLSEWQSWAEVAKWGARQFAQRRPPDRAIAAKAAALSREHPDPAKRFLAALRFVQDEVRYFAFMMGPNSHRPHAPEWVLQRRHGDCKDKTGLLFALLGEMGIESVPALVNTSMGASLPAYLPSPLMFTHVILRAKVGARELWVDATRSLERGPLDELEAPPFHRALIVSPQTEGLTRIPRRELPEPRTEVEERFSAAARNGPAQLEVVTRYRGSVANAMRHSFADTTPAQVTKGALNFYARTDAEIRSLAEATIHDDETMNVITVTETYEIKNFWKDGARQFYAWAIDQHLVSPRISQRKMPLGISHPVDTRYVVKLEVPEPIPVKPERETFTSTGFRFESALGGKGRQIRLDYRYRSLADEVLPEDVASHLAAQKKVQDAIGYSVTIGAGSHASTGYWQAGYLATVGAMSLAFLLLGRKRRR